MIMAASKLGVIGWGRWICLFASESAPGAFVTIEVWESQADLDAHMASPHIAQMITVAGDHLDGFPALHTLRSLAS